MPSVLIHVAAGAAKNAQLCVVKSIEFEIEHYYDFLILPSIC